MTASSFDHPQPATPHSARRRRWLLIPAGAMVLLLVVTLASFDALRPRVAGMVSVLLNMDVSLDGPLSLDWSPRPTFQAQDVTVVNRGSRLLQAARVRVVPDLSALLRLQLRVDEVHLDGAELAVDRDGDGRWSFSTGRPVDLGRVLPLGRVTVSRSSLRYRDERSGREVLVEDLAVVLRDIRLPAGEGRSGLERIALDGQVTAGWFTAGELKVSGLAMSLRAEDGRFEVRPSALGEEEAFLRLDLGTDTPRLAARFTVPSFRIEKLFARFSDRELMSGLMSFHADLEGAVGSMEEFVGTLNGSVALAGEGLELHEVDLDRLLEQFQKTQQFNLVDVSALLLAGPVGAVVTKSNDYTNLLRASRGGSGTVEHMVSEWKLDHGVATVRDVALATRRHRVAVAGALDLSRSRFDKLIVSVLDDRGCATVSQTIDGSFEKPEVQPVNVLGVLLAPVVGAVDKTVGLLVGKKGCEVVYKGSLLPPKR